MSHLYKNRLQCYVQKRSLPLPVYAYETDGPPHARRFKAKVTVNGTVFESPIYFPTLRDAANGAAKVAFESLSPDAVQDDGLHKSLLQELAQKRGFRVPTYSTVISGQSHCPVFMTTVVVGEESFLGQEAKTKKLAEMSAAKVAYDRLTEGGGSSNGGISHVKVVETFEDLSSHLQSVIKLQGLAEQNRGVAEISSAVNQSVETKTCQPNGTPDFSGEIQQKVRPYTQSKDEEIKPKRLKCASPDDGSSLTLGSSDDLVTPGTAAADEQKVVVCPKVPGMNLLDNSVIASNDKWVALRRGIDQAN